MFAAILIYIYIRLSLDMEKGPFYHQVGFYRRRVQLFHLLYIILVASGIVVIICQEI